MLRYLSPGRNSAPHTPGSPRGSQPVLTLHVPNYGLIIIPAPEAPGPDGQVSDEPREDHMLHGVLEVRLDGPTRRCKAIRVGFRTVIKLDLHNNKKLREEDVLFERKVEMVGSKPEDGLVLHPGSQRFDFTIILPANLAPHDWHPNGAIQHYLYAELEGLPEVTDFGMNRVGSSTSLFSFRSASKQRQGPTTTGSSSRAPSRSRPRSGVGSRSDSRAPSRTPSRAPSPGPSSRRPLPNAHTAPVSGAATPNGRSRPLTTDGLMPHILAGALANLDLNPNGTAVSPSVSPLPSPTLPGVNPAYLSAAHSMSLTRREEPELPRTPTYENAMSPGPSSPSSGMETPPDWLQGSVRVDRKCMLVYNPDISGGASGFDDSTNGFVNGLGVWDLTMISDIWSISALLGMRLKITGIPSGTTIFAMRLLLAQTHSIISPRNTEASNKIESTRNFAVVEAGRRPPPGHHHPDRHYPALWRGTGVPGGKDAPVAGTDGGELLLNVQGRLPTDDVGRPSTLPGVVTPINVTHALVLEVYFSVWAEDDRGGKMRIPGPGGLRMLRVSRPVTLPSCTLVPQIVALPRYGDHEKDEIAQDTHAPLPEENTGFGWTHCACGMKLDEMQARMKAATVAEATPERVGSSASLADMLAAAQAEDKAYAERGRRRATRNGSV